MKNKTVADRAILILLIVAAVLAIYPVCYHVMEAFTALLEGWRFNWSYVLGQVCASIDYALVYFVLLLAIKKVKKIRANRMIAVLIILRYVLELVPLLIDIVIADASVHISFIYWLELIFGITTSICLLSGKLPNKVLKLLISLFSTMVILEGADFAIRVLQFWDEYYFWCALSNLILFAALLVFSLAIWFRQPSDKMTSEQKLRLLKDKRDYNVISEEEYSTMKMEVLSQM